MWPDLIIWGLIVLLLIIGQTFLAMAGLKWFVDFCARHAPKDPYDFDEFDHDR